VWAVIQLCLVFCGLEKDENIQIKYDLWNRFVLSGEFSPVFFGFSLTKRVGLFDVSLIF
jgi:hypothetical protein